MSFQSVYHRTLLFLSKQVYFVIFNSAQNNPRYVIISFTLCKIFIQHFDEFSIQRCKSSFKLMLSCNPFFFKLHSTAVSFQQVMIIIFSASIFLEVRAQHSFNQNGFIFLKMFYVDPSLGYKYVVIRLLIGRLVLARN